MGTISIHQKIKQYTAIIMLVVSRSTKCQYWNYNNSNSVLLNFFIILFFSVTFFKVTHFQNGHTKERNSHNKECSGFIKKIINDISYNGGH